jgi:hypothetical protein
MNATQMWHFYVRRGKVYLPTVALTDAGYFLDLEPVEVIDATDTEELTHSLTEAILAGNQVISAPTRTAHSQSVVSKTAGVKSCSAFEKGACCYSVYRKPTGYEIPALEQMSDGGWVENMDMIENLPLSMLAGEVAARLVAKILPNRDKRKQ